jgi:putative ABC transport system permease protein
MTGEPGYYFLANNVSRLQTPQKHSFYTALKPVSSFVANNKLNNELRRTDVAYWDILDFKFVEGQAFDAQAFENGANHMVINEHTKAEYFGEQSAVGQSIVIDQQAFIVVGVVENVSPLETQAFADMWVPYTTLPSTAYQQEMIGDWQAMLYHFDPDQREAMQSEFLHLLQNDARVTDPKLHFEVISAADTPIEKLARSVANTRDYDSGAERFIAILIGLALAFMLLPSINLINLNISRVMERASEIGVRKAFGASGVQLVGQFMVENLLVVLVGGLLGLMLSVVAIYLFEMSNFLPLVELSISFNVLAYGLVMVTVFGLLSGAYPAYKMAKLHPVNALKGGA